MPRNWKLPIAIVLAALALDARAAAPVWIPPGDIALRDTVERLVDERVIDIPLLSWPIATAELRTALEDGRRAGRITPAHELAVARVEAALAPGRRAWWAAAGQASDLRTFADDPREEGELGLRTDWRAGERIAGEIAVRVTADPDDGHRRSRSAMGGKAVYYSAAFFCIDMGRFLGSGRRCWKKRGGVGREDGGAPTIGARAADGMPVTGAGGRC